MPYCHPIASFPTDSGPETRPNRPFAALFGQAFGVQLLRSADRCGYLREISAVGVPECADRQ
jgi:hypothetical protein